jgi:hypothetical protein
MKKITLLFLFSSLCYGIPVAIAQNDPGSDLTGRIVFEIRPGENIVNDESCFLFSLNSGKTAMVTSVGTGKNKQFYNYYADGRKEGPFRRPDSTIWLQCRSADESSGKYEYVQTDPAERYLKMESDAYYVTFNGQRFGPYQFISNFVVAEDKSNFYASGFTSDKKAHFFDGTGRDIQVVGMVDKILMSPDGKKAILMTSGNFNLYDEDELAKVMEHPEELSNPQDYYYEITGERKGPFDPSEFRDIWFTMNNRLVYRIGNDLFMDEKLLFGTQNYFNPEDLYIGDKGDKYVYSNYENIYFSDGFVAPFPLLMQVFNKGDQMVVKWVTLEDGKNLVEYQRIF